jgi:hypothetical protein
MNQHLPPPRGEPEWPYWWLGIAMVGYSGRVIENNWDVQPYSYVVVPQ